MNKLIAIPLIFFFLLFLTPANAVATMSNISLSGTYTANFGGIRCLNSTLDNEIYCYLLSTRNTGLIELLQYDENLTLIDGCDLKTYTGVTYGFNMINATYFTVGFPAFCVAYNYTSGWCNVLSTDSSIYSCRSSSRFLHGTFYTNQSWIYNPKGYITNLSNSLIATKSFCGGGSEGGEDMLPNRSNNNTLWCRNQTVGYLNNYAYELYLGGTFSQTIPAPNETFGSYMTGSQAVVEDIITHNTGTDYIYIVVGNGLSGGKLYKANWSLVYSSNLTSNTTTTTTTTEDWYSDFFGTLGTYIGYLFGITDTSLAKNISAIVLSLIFSFILAFLFAIKGNIKGNALSNIFIWSCLLFLVLFTISGWFPVWLIAILIIIASIGMGSILSRMV